MANKRIYVGNLAYRTTEDTLRNLFSQYGDVASVNVITDRESGRSKGFGFVEMTTDTGANAAIAALNGQSLDGRAITVAEARPPAERGGGRGRSGGGGGRSW